MHDKITVNSGKINEYFHHIRLVPVNRHRKQTRDAILIGGKRGIWYPKSQLTSRNGYLYATEWILIKKRGY